MTTLYRMLIQVKIPFHKRYVNEMEFCIEISQNYPLKMKVAISHGRWF